MLFTLLIDDCTATSPKDLWSPFYDFFVDAETFNLIQQQSRNLLESSRSLQSWAESKYGDIIRIVNSETLSILHRFWTQYSDSTNGTKKIFDQVQSRKQKTYHEHHEKAISHDLARSSGAACPALKTVDPDSEIPKHARQFWAKGFLGPQATSNRCFSNPLFLYSSVSDRQFAVHESTDPRNGFHLVTSLAKLTPDSPYYQERRDGRGVLDMASESAAIQFRAWCDSFRRLVQKSRNEKCTSTLLRIQFCVGDAIQLCIILNGLRQGFSGHPNRYSRPWSARPMILDGHGYTPNSVTHAAPTTFNVIDISYLSDHVGFLNILPVAIPLLEQSPAATLYTSIALRMEQEEPYLLRDLFRCTDVGSMCTLFGIAPTAYLSGLTTRAYCQDNPYNSTVLPVTNRMVWRLAAATDLTLAAAKSYCDAEDLANLLYEVYVRMFPFEYRSHIIPKEGTPLHRQPVEKGPYYTRASFATLLVFLKPRVISDWTEMMHHLLEFISSDQNLRDADRNGLDLIFHLHLTGAYTKFPFTRSIQYLRSSTSTGVAPLWPYPQGRGLFMLENPPKVTAAVVTIPRKKIQAIRNKITEVRDTWALVPLPLNFVLHIRQTNGVDHHFSSLQLIFGRLTVSTDGRNCVIEDDPNGWYGSSDLHICAYVPTTALLAATPDEIDIAITINPEGILITILKDILGTELHVFRGNAFDDDHVFLFESLPGLTPPSPTSISCDSELLEMSTQMLEVTHPSLDPENRTLTTRMTLRRDKELEALRDGGTVDYKQFSPCTVTVRICSMSHNCSFPFPVASDGARLRIARKTGWVELIVPLVDPASSIVCLSKRGVFYLKPFPIVKCPDNTLLSWNLPSINFPQLPKIDTAGEGAKWINTHLQQQMSAREFSLGARGLDSEPILAIKLAIYQMLLPTSDPVFRLGTSPFYFFISDLFIDLTSRSIVAEAYVLQSIPGLNFFPTVDAQLRTGMMDTSMWAWALQAMAERCRDWNHTGSCEYYKTKLPGSIENVAAPLCSCGMGKVGEGFLKRKAWRPFAKYVTRVAISPLFVAPWIEPTRDIPDELIALKEKFSGILTGPESGVVSDQREKPKCRVCSKEATKKCGKCKRVSYCSRDCQEKDWKYHKRSCAG